MSDLRQAAEAVLDAWFRSGSKILEMQPHMERLAGALEQPPEERNFCPRCGKRAIGDVHTCTPPLEEHPCNPHPKAPHGFLRPTVSRRREHITDGTPCWCNSETVYTDPDTGASVIVHREPQ